MLSNLEEKIINKIEKDKVRPLSRSFFLLKRIMCYLLLASFFLLSGLSLSVLFLIIYHGDFDIYSMLGTSPWFFFLQAFPYFWLIGALVFLAVAFYRTRKSDTAYHYPLIYQGLPSLVLIIILALGFYFSGLSQKVETYLANNSIYRQVNYFRSSWENPEKGLLAGTLEIENGKMFLHDFDGVSWMLENNKNNILGQELLKDEKKIKVIGEILSTSSDLNIFLISEVRSWECSCPHCAQMAGSCTGCTGGNSCSKTGSCGMSD